MEDDRNYNVGPKVQEILDKKGISQKELAAWLGIQQSQISKMLANDINFGYKTLLKIADIIEVPVQAFIDDDYEKTLSAAETVKTLPDYVVEKLEDPRNKERVLVGFNLDDLNLSPKEIELIVRTYVEIEKKLKG